MKYSSCVRCFFSLLLFASLLSAEESSSSEPEPIGSGFGKRWVVTPTLTSNPKLGTSIGAAGMVFFRFDESQTSTAFLAASYSDTESWILGGGVRAWFDADRQQIIALAFRGHAVNEYDNFLDLGIRLDSDSDVLIAPLIYRHRLGDAAETDWWLGGQAAHIGMTQTGNDPASDRLIKGLGLDEGRAYFVGPNVLFDDRDNVNSPESGSRLAIMANMWQQIQPEIDDDIFFSSDIEYSTYYTPEDVVLAANFKFRSTYDAPLLYQSSLTNWRAYTVGEQYGENLLHAQVETRIPLAWQGKFGMRAFTGIAALFDDFDDDWSTFPMGGMGVHYLLQQEERVIVRMEFAVGKDGANGFYIAIGQAFQ